MLLGENVERRARLFVPKGDWYDTRSLLGNSNWALTWVLLGARPLKLVSHMPLWNILLKCGN